MTGDVGELRAFLPRAGVRAPEVSKWTVGMHLHHSCLAMIGVCRSLIRSQPPAPPSRFSPIVSLIFLTGRIPRGRGRAPDAALPSETVTVPELEALLDECDRLLGEARAQPPDAWFEHFAFGSMNRDRTLRFLRIHNRHHARIVRDILAG
jgi:hypothetical protein